MLAWTTLLIALGGLGLGALGPWVFDLDLFAHFRGHFALVAFLSFSLFASTARFAAAALAASLFTAGVVGMWPAWRAPAIAAPAGCATERLTISAANLLIGNRRIAEIEAALLAEDADIVVTLETSEAFHAGARELQAAYPHRAERLRTISRTYGAVIWSQRPVLRARADVGSARAPIHALGAVRVGASELGLAALHFSWPVLGPQERQIASLDALLADLPERRVLIGDFNAAPWSYALLDVERRSGTQIVGGLRRTWRGRYPTPAPLPPLPELIGHQIDHALVSDDVGVVSMTTFDVPGSDHEGVTVVIEAPTGAC